MAAGDRGDPSRQIANSPGNIRKIVVELVVAPLEAAHAGSRYGAGIEVEVANRHDLVGRAVEQQDGHAGWKIAGEIA